jgi:hypothetical protein
LSLRRGFLIFAIYRIVFSVALEPWKDIPVSF